MKSRKKKKKKKRKDSPRSSVRPTRKAAKQRGGVVLVVPKDGKTYTDVVQTLRTADTPDHDLQIREVTRTKDGAALVRTKGDADAQGNLIGRLREILRDQGSVKDMTQKVILEILDLDCLTKKEEVQKALNGMLNSVEDRRISVLGPNSRGQKMAICELGDKDATRMLETRRIKIGFVNCRVRPRLMVPRCYKCLGYGHYRQDCTGPDRRDCCWKCGKPGHVAKACPGSPSCFLCSSWGRGSSAHVAGTAACHAFKTALTEAKTGQQNSRTK